MSDAERPSDGEPAVSGRFDRNLDRVGAIAGSVFDLVMETYRDWRDDRTLRLGAGLAYYGLFAVVPLVAFTIAVVGWVFTLEEAQEFVFTQLEGLINVDLDALADRIAAEIDAATTISNFGLVGIVALLISASLVFVALQDALNVIWHAPYRAGIRFTIRRRLVAFGIVVLTSALVIASIVVHAITGLAERLIPGNIAVFEDLAGLIAAGVSWILGVLAIALIYRVLTYVHVPWGPALVSAFLAAFLIAGATSLFGTYVSRYGASSVTGVAGVAVLGLLLIYMIFQITLAGAQLTKVLTRHGHFVPGGHISTSNSGSSPESS